MKNFKLTSWSILFFIFILSVACNKNNEKNFTISAKTLIDLPIGKHILVDLTQEKSYVAIDKSKGAIDYSKIIIISADGSWQTLDKLFSITKAKIDAMPSTFYVNHLASNEISSKWVCDGCACDGHGQCVCDRCQR
jgi:hypothetical protein